MKCLQCLKDFSKQTLNKHRGKYCKGCYFKVLENENKDIQEKYSLNLKILHKHNIFIEGGKVPFSGNIHLYNAIGKIVYEGVYKLGKKCGKGILYRENGSILYEGTWNNDVLVTFEDFL